VAAKRAKSRTRSQLNSSAPAGPSAPIWILLVLLVAAAAWAYSTSFAGVLVLDDVRAIVRNPTIRTLRPLSTPLSPPAASTVAGRPVANFTFALNFALAPADAREVFTPEDPGAASGSADRFLRNIWGYHFLNLVIHLAAGLVLFGIVRRTLSNDRLRARFGASATWLAFAVAMLWLVHPLQTAAVTYVVQRVESLMGLFYLLTLYCAIRAGAAPRARGWTAAAIMSCALGMATKEVMVTAPIAVGLWHWVFGNETARRSRWPLLAGLGATWVIFGVLVWHEHRGPSIEFSGEMAWRYLLTQAEVITHYLRLSVVPSPLVFLYTWPIATSLADVAVAAAFVAILVALVAVGIVRRSPLGFAGAWFFLILAPTSSVVPIVTEVAAEHRMYLPLAAVVAFVAIGLYAIGRRLLAKVVSNPRTLERTGVLVSALLTVVIAASLATATRARNRDYWSAERLWRDTVSKQPENRRARVACGDALSRAGRFAEAEAQYTIAVGLDPGDPAALVGLGGAQAAQDRLDEAIPNFERALASRPDDVDAHRLLGLAYAARRQDDRAIVHLERALEVQADEPVLLGQLAAILADSRDTSLRNSARAVDLAERAVRLTSRRDAMALETLAVAQAAAGHLVDAASATVEALRLARARGDQQLISRLEYRLSAYEALQRSRPPQ
jgi:Flp pilus assembly protein TadD